MNHYVYAPKLHENNLCRVISPSRSLSLISAQTRDISNKILKTIGINISFGIHSNECNESTSSSVENRVQDIQEAFLDSNINLVLSGIGGFNSIQIIDHIDYDIIRNNPKIICGYSDVTVLLNAIHAQTGLVTYYGPHYSSFGMKIGNEFTIDYFKKVAFQNEAFFVGHSKTWSEDSWFLDQDNRTFLENNAPIIIQRGYGEGPMIGGNINAFRLTNGTSYQAPLKGKILFLENDGLDGEFTDREFDRRLESILLQKDGNLIQGVIIGRFKSNSNMTIKKIENIITNKKGLKGIPVVYGYDFGHSMPMLTIPIGGYAIIDANNDFPIWTWKKF